MEIRIPLISYGKRVLLEGDFDTLILKHDHVRWIGECVYDCLKYDSEYEREDRRFDFDVIVPKSAINYIENAYDNEEGCWAVSIHTAGEAGITLRYESRMGAALVHEKIVRWYFEGIVE